MCLVYFTCLMLFGCLPVKRNDTHAHTQIHVRCSVGCSPACLPASTIYKILWFNRRETCHLPNTICVTLHTHTIYMLYKKRDCDAERVHRDEEISGVSTISPLLTASPSSSSSFLFTIYHFAIWLSSSF